MIAQKKMCRLFLVVALLANIYGAEAQDKTEAPVIKVDLAASKGPMKPIWAWFGYDEPNYTYMKDGKKLLSEISKLSSVPVYVRAHSLLCTGDGVAALKWGSTNAYTEDANGNPIYNWHIVDSIFDTYIERGMKPLAQIGFMPEALSSHPVPYRHYWKPGDPYTDIITGWAYPPKDYNKWRELVYQWVKHSVARYGQKEVESWYWEVWNEPNGHYWKGTEEEFLKLYDYAADGLKKALPTARIGGINIAGTSGRGALKWTNDFIKHCLYETNFATGKKGSPLEAILFHAKGNPKMKDGAVWMNMSPQLRDIEAGIKTALAYPETKNLPLIVGESDPEGCAACGMATNPDNGYRNGTMYSSYTVASFARKYELAEKYQANLVGAVSWSFEFENQPWFYGFRDLATNGVDKPVLNVFRMFGMMKGDLVTAESNRRYPLQAVLDSSVRGSADIGALASKDKKTAAVMVWNYHDEDRESAEEPISIELSNIPAKNITLTQYRIDKENSNSYEAWKKMGSPQQPTAEQIALLEKAGQLATMGKPQKITVTSGKASILVSLARQGVALLKMDW
ncbi:MAG: beta-xylosidase [Chitinophagaceae bacterium]